MKSTCAAQAMIVFDKRDRVAAGTRERNSVIDRANLVVPSMHECRGHAACLERAHVIGIATGNAIRNKPTQFISCDAIADVNAPMLDPARMTGAYRFAHVHDARDPFVDSPDVARRVQIAKSGRTIAKPSGSVISPTR